MGLYYHPDSGGFSASSWLGTIAGTMYNEYLDYWDQQDLSAETESSEADRAQFARLIDVAAALRQSLHSLSADSRLVAAIQAFVSQVGLEHELDPTAAAGLARALVSHPIIDHGIQIDLASDASDRLLEGAERRFGDLVELVAARHLGPRAAAYIDRATRLYLWGFEPETVVMCAAALEAAYESRFSSLDMFELQIRKDGKRFEPWQYEQAAYASKVFSSQDREFSRDIREARNDVVHAVPAIALTPKLALERTGFLLTRLFPS